MGKDGKYLAFLSAAEWTVAKVNVELPSNSILIV